VIDAGAVAARFALGRTVGEPVRVHGGLLNRLWRIDTEGGSFAVKELNLDRGWALRHDDVLRLEQAAFAAGVPMPQPVPDPTTGSALAVIRGASVIVHRWVDGAPMPPLPVSCAIAHEVGVALARLHALHVDWPHVSIEDPMPTEAAWRDLADRAVASRQPWADALAAAVPALGEIGRRVDAAGHPEPLVLTHKDIGQKNLLDVDGNPVIVDWETSGMLPLAYELGQTALGLARGEEVDAIEPAVFAAVLDGYVDGGGTLPAPGEHWFTGHLSGWTWFLRWNVERCLTGVEPVGGPGLAVAHDVVARGVRLLPEALALLPQHAALTVR
jgi:Ser/Thr protein kinase RdoA (MazF antagonist)